jgi:Zn-dependent peptidase ImmA (M78 family)
MHDLSHRIRGHETQDIEVSAEGLILSGSYDKKQEEEADWLSGCLLLPRDALIAIKNRSLDLDDAAQIFGVSLRMLKYRFAMTGVSWQFV